MLKKKRVIRSLAAQRRATKREESDDNNINHDNNNTGSDDDSADRSDSDPPYRGPSDSMGAEGGNETAGDKKSRQAQDPDEPRYCICRNISYGHMVGCDNDDCVIEWFHFVCVALKAKPRGKWYCPSCREGDNCKVKRPQTKAAHEAPGTAREASLLKTA